jgi:hypothetical protein
MDLLDKWDPEFEDVGTLSPDNIYHELSRLDAFEPSRSSKQGKKDRDNPDKGVKNDTNAKRDSEETQALDNLETRMNTVLRDIDTRRTALQVGAMELSCAKIRPTTIVDLHVDILLQIFGYFQDTRVGRQAQISWGLPHTDCEDIARRAARKTIRQIRLVCSLFNDLASPLLCPILRINIDTKSLKGAIELCKRPRIAQGVHAVQVGLQYRPKELVSYGPAFKDYCKQQLENMIRLFDRYLEGHKSDDQTACPLDLTGYQEAKRNYGKLSRSWDDYFYSDESDENDKNADVNEAEADECIEILVQAYNEYLKKHEEQLQLITSGSFVTTLASCISQLPNTITLDFTDEMEPLYDRDNPIILLRDTSLLPGMMSAALEWEKIDNLRHGNHPLLTRDAKLTPARILFDLPVAIHKAGVKLRYLDLGPFPCRGSFSLLCPDAVSNPPDPAAWLDLRAACSSLWRVDFGMNFHNLYIRREHLRPEEKYYVDQYLSTVLCSADLKTVWLDLRSFCLNDGRITSDGWYDIGPVLSAVNWPRVERIRISEVSSKQDELERFCSGLGPSMRHLSLWTIHLLDGRWEGILRTLDEKMRTTFCEQNVSVHLSNLTGGEFGEVEIKERPLPLGFGDLDDEEEPPKSPPAAGELLKKQYAPLFSI